MCSLKLLIHFYHCHYPLPIKCWDFVLFLIIIIMDNSFKFMCFCSIKLVIVLWVVCISYSLSSWCENVGEWKNSRYLRWCSRLYLYLCMEMWKYGDCFFIWPSLRPNFGFRVLFHFVLSVVETSCLNYNFKLIYFLFGRAGKGVSSGGPRTGKRRQKCTPCCWFLCNMVWTVYIDGSRTWNGMLHRNVCTHWYATRQHYNRTKAEVVYVRNLISFEGWDTIFA